MKNVQGCPFIYRTGCAVVSIFASFSLWLKLEAQNRTRMSDFEQVTKVLFWVTMVLFGVYPLFFI
ncbi:hypothetical protein E4O04_07765 [Treponema sp. OMZ 799]|uniref:hypothetical protein n=2 Tax=Treponema TaxID=157 RepID=UPI0020A2774E|nr:hypothetical protein [Treponema sp. OMZ 799]UTC77902.1 hypothetical protein E4O04_07765 [Treponema sp. OMZ 799]